MTETVVAQKPAQCKGQNCKPQQVAQQATCNTNYSCKIVFPSQNVFAQELEGFINDNCNTCSFRNQGQMVVVRGGGILNRIKSRLVSAFPTAVAFRRASKAQRATFFRTCLR